MAVCISEDGVLTRVPLAHQPTMVLLDLIHATYGHLSSLFGEDDREPAGAPGWTILTPDGVAYLDHSGYRHPQASPRFRPGAVVAWAITGSCYPTAAWIHKAVGRPPGTTATLL